MHSPSWSSGLRREFLKPEREGSILARKVGSCLPVDRWQYTRRLSEHLVSHVVLIFRIAPRRHFVRKVKRRRMTLTSCRRCHDGVKHRRRRPTSVVSLQRGKRIGRWKNMSPRISYEYYTNWVENLFLSQWISVTPNRLFWKPELYHLTNCMHISLPHVARGILLLTKALHLKQSARITKKSLFAIVLIRY